MELFVGAGEAGSAIVDEMFGHKNMNRVATPLAFNSTYRDLQSLSNIGPEQWCGIAKGKGLVPGTTAGFENEVSGGFGRDPTETDEVLSDLAADGRITETLREYTGDSESTADVSYAFIFVGLGGGTGCGSAHHIARAIKELADERTWVVAVGVLPNTEGPVSLGSDETETKPSRQAWNAKFGLDNLEQVVDGIVLIDNQRLSYHVAAEGKFSEFNEYVASAFVDLVAGSLIEQVNPSEFDDIDTQTIDLRDILTSISFGRGSGERTTGYAVLGRSVTMTQSLAGYLLPVVGTKDIDSTALTQLADSKLSLANIDPDEAEKALGLVRAPAGRIKDVDNGIETSVFRRHLQAKCGEVSEVNLGVSVTQRNLASFSMLLTYRREGVPRLEEIEELAHRFEANRAEI